MRNAVFMKFTAVTYSTPVYSASLLEVTEQRKEILDFR
jgi:hypothetical protein